MEYSELLRNPYWQKKRLEIFNRDNWACSECTNTLDNLQVHHLYYKIGLMPWEYPDHAYKTLCSLCHFKVEFYKFLEIYAPMYLKRYNFEGGDIIEVIGYIRLRLSKNHNRESVENYISDIKKLLL